jgi:Flp pilus assembly protein TadG
MKKGASVNSKLAKQFSTTKRAGAALVESALVLPVLFLLTFGLIMGGMGIYRFQAMSSLAREAARYASVHGTNYQTDTSSAAVTKANIYNAAIVPQSAGLDLSQLTYTIYYTGSAGQQDWDAATHSPVYVKTTGGVNSNKTATVTVTLSYQWSSLLYFPTITLTSTSVMPMSY